MSKYYEALRCHAPESDTAFDWETNASWSSEEPDNVDITSTDIVPLPAGPGTPFAVSRRQEIKYLSERLAPLTVVDRSMRLLITGCSAGDGTSTIASAFALDLSQRLSLRTMLIDAHLRNPTLTRIFQQRHKSVRELVLDGPLQIRASGWPRLNLATCSPETTDGDLQDLHKQFENVLRRYSAVVVDLGVVRLDTRMLPLARPSDPVLIVVRQGHTRRRELATTTAALRTANRSTAGVIFNAATSSVAQTVRKLTKR